MFKLHAIMDFFFPRLMLDSGGGGGGPSTSTTNTTNIPEYARPYVETMLGATQKQLFNTTTNPDTGNTEITGMRPFQAYGDVLAKAGDINPQTGEAYKGGEKIGYDVNRYVAGASPMQETAYGSAANMQVAPQTQLASGMAGQAGLQALGTQYDPMMARTQNFGMGAAQRYMDPYAMAAMQPTLNEQARQAAIQGQQNQAQAVGRGAFGGSRDALMRAENQRNLGMLQNKTITEGMNTAYNNAMQQFNADQARAMQAQQANIGQQQFGANLGMQGLSTALNAANQLGTLGQNQYGQQTGIIGLQNQLGQQQQQLEQQKINQQIQDYATGQQWGMQQLSNMNAMLRGLPLQTTSTQTYQAAPSLVSQAAGLGTAAIGASKLAGAKKGGSTKDIKKRKGDGLMDLAISSLR